MADASGYSDPRSGTAGHATGSKIQKLHGPSGTLHQGVQRGEQYSTDSHVCLYTLSDCNSLCTKHFQ